MGCEHNIAEDIVETADGDCHGLSYLVNPVTRGFVAILDLSPDHLVSETEVETWERRLGVEIPKPPI
jgi:hypothetical protein